MKRFKHKMYQFPRSIALIFLGCISRSTFATDLLAQALDGDIADSLGSGSKFWKIFILVDIMLATALAVKTKNPMVFLGVTAVAFIPAFLIKTFVF
jgi:ABC-type Fe3+-siderophore transport system permease subunit